MSKAFKNYLIHSVIIALLIGLVLLAFSLLIPPLLADKTEQSFDDVGLKLLAIFLQLLFIPLILGAYFIFKNFTIADEFEIKEYLPAFIAFLVLLSFVILLQSFGSTYLIEKKFSISTDRDWKKLKSLIAKEKNVSALEKLYQKDKLKNKKNYELFLQKLNYDFPTDLTIAKKLRNLRVDHNFETENKNGEKVIDQNSKLESRAIELKNQGDYLAAVQIFQKLIKLYPNVKSFQKKREAYEDQIKICLAKDKNKESNLQPDELLNIRINQRLKNIRKEYQEGRLFQALAKITVMRIDYDDQRVLSLYEKIVGNWKQHEFHLIPFLYQKQLFPEKTHFEKIKFKHAGWSVYCDKIYSYSDFLYIEGIVLSNAQFKKVQKYKYGCLRPNKLFLKNQKYIKSFQIEGDFLPLIKAMSLSYYQNNFLLALLGVPALFEHLDKTHTSKENINFYQWLINIKINSWIWTIGLFFLFSAFSWRSRSRLFDFWALIGLLVVLLVSLGSFALMSYSLVHLLDSRLSFHLMSGLISVVFSILSFLYFSFST